MDLHPDLHGLAFRATIDWTAVHRPVEDEIERTLMRARRLNRLNGVTGAILLFPNHVFQWIEGEISGLDDTLDCARRDPRLASLQVVSSARIPNRLFRASWMYFADLRATPSTRTNQAIHRFARGEASAGFRETLSIMEGIAKRLDPARITRAALMV
ncbi:BLUF domain-containing protein [Stappia sp. F7233]|uniref:BLUF domain-containing protein n=1 Tax=Stappia albiluteola TaxID=2758565 RepID=A0A839ACL1_9HYPH|nr:BLUF domain-containing protein [Stappia albiluteola]MBA5776607.1 BLUF domain-containing protein [Stappia albiluteola]